MCTAQKESVFGVILVRIFPAFSRIWTEYGEMRTKITPNKDSFYTVSCHVEECGKQIKKGRPKKN